MAAQQKPCFVAMSGKRRTLFIPVGLPGAGKSYLSRQLDTRHFKTISQDSIKCNMDKLMSIIEYQIQNGNKHLYIDSCNHYHLRRHKLARLALKYKLQVVIINFKLSMQDCLDALLARVNNGEAHHSVTNVETAHKAFSTISEKLEHAREEERASGISIINVSTKEEVDALSEKMNARA